MSQPDWLRRSPHATLLRSLRLMAWADGVLVQDERDAVLALATRLGVEAGEPVLLDWLEEPPDDGGGGGEGEEAVPGEVDPFDRRFLLAQALRLAWGDGDCDPEERSRVERWAEAWGVGAKELAVIEAEVRAELSDPDPFAAL
jgi:uncharacterized membrane protein YebE (DUF533 family)